MGGCQNYGPVLGTCRTIMRTQKGTMIWTTTHISDVFAEAATTFAQARKVWDPRVAVANQLVTSGEFRGSGFRV